MFCWKALENGLSQLIATQTRSPIAGCNSETKPGIFYVKKSWTLRPNGPQTAEKTTWKFKLYMFKCIKCRVSIDHCNSRSRLKKKTWQPLEYLVSCWKLFLLLRLNEPQNMLLPGAMVFAFFDANAMQRTTSSSRSIHHIGVLPTILTRAPTCWWHLPQTTVTKKNFDVAVAWAASRYKSQNLRVLSAWTIPAWSPNRTSFYVVFWKLSFQQKSFGSSPRSRWCPRRKKTQHVLSTFPTKRLSNPKASRDVTWCCQTAFITKVSKHASFVLRPTIKPVWGRYGIWTFYVFFTSLCVTVKLVAPWTVALRGTVNGASVLWNCLRM